MIRLFLLTVCLCVMQPIDVHAEDNIVVVVNKGNPISEMDQSEVIDLFMGKYVAFSSGEKAIAVDLNNSSREEFYKKLVGRSLASVNAYWSRIRFSGKRKPPIKKDSYTEIASFVSNTEFAIGYIPKDMLTNNMKVVFEFDQ